MDTLELRTQTRGKSSYEDYFVNGARLSDLLDDARGFISPLGWLDIHPDHDFRAMLRLEIESDLRPNRIPLFVCGECTAYDCGVGTVRIVQDQDCVTWSDFMWERDYDDWTSQTESERALKFQFDKHLYLTAISESIETDRATARSIHYDGRRKHWWQFWREKRSEKSSPIFPETENSKLSTSS